MRVTTERAGASEVVVRLPDSAIAGSRKKAAVITPVSSCRRDSSTSIPMCSSSLPSARNENSSRAFERLLTETNRAFPPFQFSALQPDDQTSAEFRFSVAGVSPTCCVSRWNRMNRSIVPSPLSRDRCSTFRIPVSFNRSASRRSRQAATIPQGTGRKGDTMANPRSTVPQRQRMNASVPPRIHSTWLDAESGRPLTGRTLHHWEHGFRRTGERPSRVDRRSLRPPGRRNDRRWQ